MLNSSQGNLKVGSAEKRHFKTCFRRQTSFSKQTLNSDNKKSHLGQKNSTKTVFFCRSHLEIKQPFSLLQIFSLSLPFAQDSNWWTGVASRRTYNWVVFGLRAQQPLAGLSLSRGLGRGGGGQNIFAWKSRSRFFTLIKILHCKKFKAYLTIISFLIALPEGHHPHVMYFCNRAFRRAGLAESFASN